jgi:broad specificity phosphatase PhoE
MQLADSSNVLCYVVRHGSTILNHENKFRGTANPPLDATGIQQAHTVAKLLDAIEISHIFSSDKQRATKTAEIIAAGDKLPVHHTESLRALNVGDYSGKLRTPETEAEVGAFADKPDVPFPGGESINQFRARIQPCLQEACEIALQCGVPTVIVGHSSIVHEAGNWLAGDHKCVLVEPGGMAAIYLKDGKLAVDAIYKPLLKQVNKATTLS